MKPLDITLPAARDSLQRQGFDNVYLLTDGLEGFRERCLKLGVQIDAGAAPGSAMSLDTHYQRMFIAPPHWLHRGPTNLTQRLGLPFIGMAAEAIAQRVGRA